MHLVVVVFGLWRLLRALLLRWEWAAARIDPGALAAAVCLPWTGVYALATGASPPVLRAALAAAIVLAGTLLRRELDALNGLALCALVLLALEPAEVLDPSFQLSFAAVGGLVVWAGPLRRRMTFLAMPDAPRGPEAPGAARLLEPLLEGACATLAASLATVPILAFHFRQLPLLGLPANLAAIPIGSGLTVLATAAGLTASFHPLLAAPFLYAAWPLAWALRALSDLAAAPRWGTLGDGLARPRRRTGLRGARAGGWAVARGPAPGRGRCGRCVPRRPRAAARGRRPGAGAGSRCSSSRSARATPPCCGSRTGARCWWTAAAPRREGGIPASATSFRCCATSASGGWRPCSSRILTRTTCWDWERSSTPCPSRPPSAMATRARKAPPPSWRGSGPSVLVPGASWSRAGVIFEVVGGASRRALTGNDASLVLRVTLRPHGVSLPGRRGGAGERRPPSGAGGLAADVVKVPHHGSRTSSSAAFVTAVGAHHAVVSVGAANRFGFPRAETAPALERQRRRGAAHRRRSRPLPLRRRAVRRVAAERRARSRWPPSGSESGPW